LIFIKRENLTQSEVAFKSSAPAGLGVKLIIRLIHRTVIKLYDEVTVQIVRIQYDGSVDPGKIAEFMAHPEIEGVLVGWSSLMFADFVAFV